MALNRRDTLAALLSHGAALAGLIGANAAGAEPPGSAALKFGRSKPFSFDQLKAEARARADKPYVPPTSPPADLMRAVNYDAYGQITYRPEATLWKDQTDTAIRFFHLGRPAPAPVAIYVVDQGQARPILYSESLFDEPANSPARLLGKGAGFAGFRVLNPDHTSDWLAYLGASYFRSAEPFNQYGLSARGIAIDTATPRPEEFPSFVGFWLERDAGDNLIVHALLDGPSVAGAYRIVHHRSATGLVQDITVDLHFRAPVQRLGLAPLTSMYWYGQSDRAPADDWRPQIHDSDGLSIWTGAGERIWRPLDDPPRVMTNLFLDKSPRGFGLMQRDRRFEDYQDDGVFYDRRPSAWVEPVGDWGAGSVQLVEIPTTGESDDNIVAFWTPQAPVTAGQALAYQYRLHWVAQEPGVIGVARVVATRSGQGGRPGQPPPPGRRKFVVDFEGGDLSKLNRQSGVEPVVEARPGQPIDLVCYPVVGTDRWRMMFDLDMGSGATVDLRGYLRRGGSALTETWIHQVFAS
jgi:glucans biosynthesis protein